jgi:hypothetical protein
VASRPRFPLSHEDHVKVSLTPISKLKAPLPRFPLSGKDHEDDAGFLARVEQEARVIMGSYTHTEHKAYIAGLPNDSHLNRVLKLTGVAYGPRLAPVSTEVLKKRKADDTGRVLAKRPKAHEKKGTEPTKVDAAQVKGSLKQSSDADISSTKSAKLSKSIVHRAIAPVATVRITPVAHGSLNVSGALGSRAGGGQVIKPCPEQRRLPHPLRNASFQLLGLWLRYLWWGLRNHHCTIKYPRFSRGQSFAVDPHSFEFDLR